MIKNKFTATGIVFNESGNILMIKHKQLGKWLPPGGHVDENELPCKAVAREVMEETGISVQVLSSVSELELLSGVAKELPLPLRIMHVNIDGTGLNNYIDFLYLCRAINTDTILKESEIDDLGWFSPEEVMKMDTYEDIIKTIEYAVLKRSQMDGKGER